MRDRDQHEEDGIGQRDIVARRRVIGMTGAIENCSIGLIAGPASPATSSPRPRPPRRPRRGLAERGTSLSGASPPDKRELRLCRGLWAKSTRITFHTPRPDPEQKKDDVKTACFQQPVEAPADRAADDDRRDELAARAQAHRHRRAALLRRRRGPPACGGGIARARRTDARAWLSGVSSSASSRSSSLRGLGHGAASLPGFARRVEPWQERPALSTARPAKAAAPRKAVATAAIAQPRDGAVIML